MQVFIIQHYTVYCPPEECLHINCRGFGNPAVICHKCIFYKLLELALAGDCQSLEELYDARDHSRPRTSSLSVSGFKL